MLVQIAIRNIVLIDRLDLEFGPGLTILTGETGAGKSILLDALSLALGARGDGGLVRQGEREGQVAAVFRLSADHPAAQAARQAGAVCDGDLILRRVQSIDGRTRAFVNDEPVSAQALRRIGAELVEIHGQHDDRALVDAGAHRALIDAFADHEELCAKVRLAHSAARGLRIEIEQETARLAAVRAEADFLRHAYAELTRLDPRAGEESELSEQRTSMMQAERVAGELGEAQQLLGGDNSPIAALSALAKRLGRRAPQAPALIDPCLAALDAALDALDLAAQAVESAVRESRFDPRRLEQVEERLFALRAAGRKYAARPDDLPDVARSYAERLQSFEAGETRLEGLRGDLEAAVAEYQSAARDLSARRREAADLLARKVNSELAPLKLEGARVWAEIQSDEAAESPEGFDRIEFWVQTNAGSRPGPLMKVASGGELARILLALKVALADRGSAPTLIFDEIDAGAGGAVADAIGQRLARLASGVQVLAVTHAPQVAARASGHFRIRKKAGGRGAMTEVVELESDSRREEIARMLAGATVTEEARAAARRLLEAG